MNVTSLSKNKKRKSPIVSKESDSVRPAVINSLKGALAGPISGFIILLVMSAIAYRTKDPASLVPILSYAALLVSAFAAGVVSVRLNRGYGMLCGAITGTVYLIFIFICSLFLHSPDTEQLSFGTSLGLRSIVIFASILGGCLGEKKEKKQKRRKKSLR